MTRRLEELVRQATVPLTDAAGGLLGTAFFIAPGLAVTAAHVVHGALERKVFAPDSHGVQRALTVRVQHPPTVAPGVDPYPLPDLALLDAAPGQFEDTPCVFLQCPGTAKELLAFGYSKSIDPRGVYAPDVARLDFEAAVRVQGVDVIKVRQATVDPGMSGAPVLDLDAGAIVGYVKASRGAGKPYGAYVVAMSELQRYEHSAWGKSELHHRVNSAWRAAKAGDFEGLDPVAATSALAEAVIREAQSRHDMLPEGVDVAALHQTIWLRHRLPVNSKPGTSMTDVAFRQRWHSERPLSGLTVVSADPGFGKSWLLAYQASQVARQALHHLDEGGSVDDCVISARLSCATLGVDVDISANVHGLARTLVAATLPSGPADQDDERGYVAAVERALADGRMLICLDGLDEMPIGHRPQLKKTLLALLSLNNAVLLATRPAALPIIEEIAIGNREDFELVGFTFRETVNFVRVWLRDRPQSADSLLRAFADRSELAQLAEVPLLLSFLCRLADPIQRRDYRKTTLSQLYHDVTRHLLSGRWHSGRTPAETEAMPDPVLRMRLLADVMGSLQDTWRGGTEDIIKADLRTAIRRHPEYDAVAATAAVRMTVNLESTHNPSPDASDPVMWEFLYDGILVEATDAPLRPTVRFIHPILREMLLATYFVALPPEDQLGCIDRHRWLDASWTRVIVASASLAADPAPLVAHILSGIGDPWVTQRTLAAQMIAEAPNYRDDATAQAVLDAILTGIKSPLVFEQRRAISALGILLRSPCRTLRAWAHDRMEDIGADVEDQPTDRGNVDSAINYETVASLLEARDSDAARPAQALMAAQHCPPNVRFRLIGGLIALNTRQAVDMVLELLERPPAAQEDLAAFLAALQPHADLAVTGAIRLLRNRQIRTAARVQVARALLECGPVGMDAVREVADDRTMNWSIRCRLYAEMLRAAIPDITASALHLLASPYPQYHDRAELTLALIEDGATDAIPEAALALSNPLVDWTVRRALARALARQGRAGRDLLMAQLNHTAIDLGLKVRHICALIEVRDPHGSDAALRLHHDRGVQTWIRMRLAETLLRFNAGLADEEALIELATTDDQPVEERANLITEMIRHAFPSAEMVLMNLLRDHKEGIIAWPDTSMRMAEAGTAGHRCLEAVAQAQELDWSLRCEALLSLGKTLGGTTLPAATEEIVNNMPEIWRNRLVLGLARVGLAPDLDAFEALVRRQHGGYRITFEFLQRASVERSVVDRLLDTACELQTHRTVEEDAPDSPHIVIGQELLTELGVTFRSEAEARQQLEWFYNTLEMRVGLRLAQLMLDEQLEEFDSYMDSEDEGAALEFLETSFPEYHWVVGETYGELKDEIRDGTLKPPHIIEVTRHAAVLPSITKMAALLSEWVGHARARRWTEWLEFAAENSAIIGSDLGRGILRLSVAADPDWGLHEAALWVAERIAQRESDHTVLEDSSAMLDWLKGQFEHGDWLALYLGGAYATQRFPQNDFSWWYAAVGAQQQDSHQLALRLVRNAGETRPPGEREDGATILEHFQPKLGWTDEITEAFRTAYMQGLDGRPLADYERAVEHDPASAQNHFNLGIALQQARRYDEAVDAYRRAVAIEPHVATRHRALAGALDAADQYDEALKTITVTLTMDRNDPVSHGIHGVILGHMGRAEDALTALREAHRLSPSNPLYLSNLGLTLLRLQRFDEAVEAHRQAVARKPYDASRRRILAVALDAAERYEEALHEITTALELDPADHEAYGLQGVILIHQGRHEDAANAFTEALRLAPETPAHLINLGIALQQARRYDEAVEACSRAVALQEHVAPSHRALAAALDAAERYEEALHEITTALELDPADHEAYGLQGVILIHQGRHEDAANAFTEALRLAPETPAHLINLGIALQQARRYDEAVEACSRAVAADLEATARRPGVSTGYRVLADSLRHLGRFDEAAAAIATGIELDPDIPLSHCTAALVFNSMGRYASALDALTRAEAMDSKSSLIRANRGEALLLCGQLDEAAQELREAIRLGPPSPVEADVLLALAIHAVSPDESATLAKRALTYGTEQAITPFRRAEFRAIAFLLEGDLESATVEIRSAAAVRQACDVLQVPLYEQLRMIAPDRVETFLSTWPSDAVRRPAPRCADAKVPKISGG